MSRTFILLSAPVSVIRLPMRLSPLAQAAAILMQKEHQKSLITVEESSVDPSRITSPTETIRLKRRHRRRS